MRSAGGGVELVAGAGDSVFGDAETFTSFEYPTLDDAGRVAFQAVTSGGPVSPSLFVDTGIARLALARAGDPAPDTGGGTLVDFLYPALGGGSVAFLSNVAGGSATGGLFVGGSSVESVAVENQVVPGAGPITSVASLPNLASDGSVVMSLAFGSGPIDGGVYVHAAGAFTPVALAGEVPPDTGGAALASFGFLSRNDAGQVAFVATLDDARTGVFSHRPPRRLPSRRSPARRPSRSRCCWRAPRRCRCGAARPSPSARGAGSRHPGRRGPTSPRRGPSGRPRASPCLFS